MEPCSFSILVLKIILGDNFFLGTISLGRVVLSSPKIVINLSKARYDKLHCIVRKRETFCSAVSEILWYK